MRSITIPMGRSGRRRGSSRQALALWRTRGPSGIGAADVSALAEAVAGTAILRERRWPAARAGEPAAAAAVGIARLRGGRLGGPLDDLVMSNLVVLACRDGDPTARVVLAHALRALARRRPERAGLSLLADAWAGPFPAGVRRNRPGRRP